MKDESTSQSLEDQESPFINDFFTRKNRITEERVKLSGEQGSTFAETLEVGTAAEPANYEEYAVAVGEDNRIHQTEDAGENFGSPADEDFRETTPLAEESSAAISSYEELEWEYPGQEWRQLEAPYITGEEELVSGSSLRDRIVEAARQAWQSWGRGAKVETDPAMRGTLRNYWENIQGIDRREAERRIDRQDPWSAAFISWVMRQAGAGDSFTYAGAHRVYIAAAKRNRQKGDATKFRAYDITVAKPEIGDIICRDRAGASGRCSGTTYANVDDGTEWPTHCDIVTEVAANYITVIGGNVSGPGCPKSGCTVNARKVSIDDTGSIIQSQGCKYFAIVKPVGEAPAVSTVNDWSRVQPNQRMRYVMDLLVTQYQYPVNGAAGIVGNLWAESGVIPNRIEGSNAEIPMRAQDFNNRMTDFTAEQIMNRDGKKKEGPRLPGVGLAQWTSRSRREGLFSHTFHGRRLGAVILFNMEAQIEYLITELGTKYSSVDTILRRTNVSPEEASDEMVYNYEVPGSILDQPDAAGRRRKLPRNDSAVQAVFARRRISSQNALRAYSSQQREFAA